MNLNMRTRSGFEYLPLTTSLYKRKYVLRKRRRIAGLLRKKVRRALSKVPPWEQPAVLDNASGLKRFMINKEFGSRSRWSQMWATQSMARRFTGAAKHPSPHTKSSSVAEEAPSDFSFPVSFRTVRNSFKWKKHGGKAIYLTVLGKRNGTVPSWVADNEAYEWCEWEMVYRTPSGSLDARFVLSKQMPCRFPCYCILHCSGASWDREECVPCYNLACELESRSGVTTRSEDEGDAVDEDPRPVRSTVLEPLWADRMDAHTAGNHISFCKSERARRYRRRKLRLESLGVSIPPSLFVLDHLGYSRLLA